MCAPTPPLPEYDQDKVDEAVLALLYLVLHHPGSYLAWKGFEWATLDRLHAKGLIGDPKHTHTSVALADAGVADAAAVVRRLFRRDGDAREHLRWSRSCCAVGAHPECSTQRVMERAGAYPQRCV